MLIGPYYRVRNDLVAADGIVDHHYHRETDRDASYSYVCLWLPSNREVLIRQREHPQEYAQYLALYDATPGLIARLRCWQEEPQ